MFMTSGTSSMLCRTPQVAEASSDLRKEALSALHVALEMKGYGKVRKASKLFQVSCENVSCKMGGLPLECSKLLLPLLYIAFSLRMMKQKKMELWIVNM